MGDWTAERVLSLAPDATSVGPARECASPGKWVSTGTTELAAWGEAKGSGAKPYQVAVDFNGPAFKCSCPSRKIPCKHVLGLLLQVAAGTVASATYPDWVKEWLEKRTEKAEVQAAKAAAPKQEVDPEAAAKRSGQRWQKVLAGLDECEAFLLDVAGQGLLSVQSTRSWDQMAARMVDAQAPGLARRLKRIGAKMAVGTDWGQEVTGEIGSIALLIEGAKRIESLADGTKSDIRTALGIPTRKEDFDGERVSDIWDVLGQILELEERVTTIRSWLRSRSTGRWAVHLSFSVAGQPPDLRLSPGTGIIAELEFYPSAWTSRAQIAEPAPTPFRPTPIGNWEDGLETASIALAANPWIEQTPASLTQARLGKLGDSWWVIDSAGASMPTRGWSPVDLLARTGNEPFEMFGEFNGIDFRPLGAWGQWGYLPL